MKKFLVLLDYDGTLVERTSQGLTEKIPFTELDAIKKKYLHQFGIKIEYRIVTSSCAKSIEDLMTMTELCLIDQWDFENGLHVRRYGEFFNALSDNEATRNFLQIRPDIIAWANTFSHAHGDMIQSISEKHCSLAIHCSSHRDQLFQELKLRFEHCSFVKSASFTIECFPQNSLKSDVMQHVDRSQYDLILFIGDSIYLNGNDYDLAYHAKVDIAIEVKGARDSAKLLENMKRIAQGDKPLNNAITEGTQARVVKDKSTFFERRPEKFYENKKFILLDFDGTLTYHKGLLYPGIIETLQELRERYQIWIITGRSKGWADMMIHTLPLDGVIGENGAFAYYRDTQRDHIHTWRSPHVDPQYKQKLAKLKNMVKSHFRFISFASDQFSREFDLAAVIDEHEEKLTQEQIDELIFWTRQQGAQAVISNIHVNIWFGVYNKAQSVIDLFREIYGVNTLDLCRGSFYIGDSPNDEPMFRLIDASFGVKNVENFLDKLRYPPAYISPNPEGMGALDILKGILKRKGFVSKSA